MNKRPNLLQELENLAFFIGTNENLVQGPAGNISVKDFSNNLAWIKKSGTCLSESLNSEIFMPIPLDFKLDGNLIPGEFKPSIEFFFHLYFNAPWIVHVHSINAVSLSARKDLDTLIEKFNYIDLTVIEYAKPGFNLHLKLSTSLSKDNIKPIILRNHGLIVFGNSSDDVLTSLIQFESFFERNLPVIPEIQRMLEVQGLNQYLNNRFITPDHAVFSLSKKMSSKLLTVSNEIDLSIAKSISKIPSFDLINFLDEANVRELIDWDLEKLRIEKNR